MSLNARRTPEEVQPYHAAVPFKPGDLLLLCSDGLWGPIQEAVLQAVAMELPPQAAADKLTSIANAQGGPDNISAVIVRRAGEHHMAAEASLADDTNPGLAQ
jgi:protein phosphatase